MSFQFQQEIVEETVANPCEIRIRPGDTVLSVLQRLRERQIPDPFRIVRELQLVPGQVVLPGCGIPEPPIPLPANSGCRGLLEVAFASVKATDTKIQASELAIGLARLRPSARSPINGFHQSLLRVPVLVIANDRFVNPFTGKNVPGVNLTRLSPDAWELVQPVLGDVVQRRISLFDLASVAAFLSQDSNFKTECPSVLSATYNPRCLGLLEALDSIDGLGVLPPSYMARPDSVYIRKRLLPDAVVPDWVETIGGSVIPKVVNGVTVEKIVIVPTLSLYDYLRNIGNRSCTPNGLLGPEVASFQEQLTIDQRLADGRLVERIDLEERTVGQNLAERVFDPFLRGGAIAQELVQGYNNVVQEGVNVIGQAADLVLGQSLANERIIGNLGNNPREVESRIGVEAQTELRGSTGVPPIDRQGYFNNLNAGVGAINPTRLNSTERYLQSNVIGGQVCRADPITGAFKCWNPG